MNYEAALYGPVRPELDVPKLVLVAVCCCCIVVFRVVSGLLAALVLLLLRLPLLEAGIRS